MKNISQSVGKGGANLRPDVVLVQTLLGAKLGKNAKSVRVDGICGPKTVVAISDYQRKVLRINQADGLVLPTGPTWKHLAASGHQTAVNSQQGTMPPATLVNNPLIRAMLDTIGYSEGTGTEYGTVVHGTVVQAPNPADVGRRNVVVTDFAKHPQMLVQVGAHLKSTAAGRYQFLSKTWAELKMPDFSADSQDIAAVKLFQRRHMIAPLLAGDFNTAVQRGSLEWASLPDAGRGGQSHYGGQPARTLAQLRTKYLSSFGSYAKR